MMRSIITKGIATTLAAASLTIGALAQAPSTAFTYQGFLRFQGIPANGVYDLQFRLFDVAQGGNPIALYNAEDVNIREGLFTVEVDFGTAPFTGQRLWMEIGVRPGNQSRPHVILDPRIELTPVPYALFSQKAKDAQNVPWSGITGMPEGFADGIDNDTTYTAGTGLSLQDNQFSIAPSGVTTDKIADGAVTDAKIQGVSWSKVTGVPNFLTEITANTPLEGDGTQNNPLKLRNGTQTGQVLKWNGSSWELGTDLRDQFWYATGPGIRYNNPVGLRGDPASGVGLAVWGSWNRNLLGTARITAWDNGYYSDWPGDWGGGIESLDMVCSGIRLLFFQHRSDIRLKRDIEILDPSDSLTRLMSLRPVKYRFRREVVPYYRDSLRYGFIAQEVQKVFPELVEEGGEDKILAVDYIALIPHLVSVIQTQQAEIDELRAKVEKLTSDASRGGR